MIYVFKHSLFLKDIQMTFNEVKPHDTTTAATPQQHHTQAAEHLELAAKSHKEAAKLLGANDHTAAHAHVKIAHGHVAKAEDHVVAAAKKTTPLAK